jgi:hypothetical protein
MKRTVIFAVALALLAACGSDGFKAEHRQLQEELASRQAKLRMLEAEHETRLGLYRQMRQEFEAASGGQIDSLPLSYLQFHDGLMLNHEALRAEHPNLTATHEGLLARHALADYPQDSILADYRAILSDYDRIEHEYEGIRADLNQMLDEQEGIARRYRGN